MADDDLVDDRMHGVQLGAGEGGVGDHVRYAEDTHVFAGATNRRLPSALVDNSDGYANEEKERCECCSFQHLLKSTVD